MFIHVKILSGFPEPLYYKVPTEWDIKPSVGSVVQVPLRNKVVAALVLACQEDTPNVSFTIKDAARFEAFPKDVCYHPFIKKLANHHQVDSSAFVKRIKGFLTQKIMSSTVTIQDIKQEKTETIVLTDEQKKVVDAVRPHVTTAKYFPTLLHGVTGSGKSIVYKELIEAAFLQQKTTIILLPEVTLAVQFAQFFKTMLPSAIPVFGFHSAVGAKEKKIVWHNLLHNIPQVIIGVHIPILLPIGNLGLIIIDEEHEIGYQEKKHPKVNSKEAAILKAQQHGVPIVLGSATPSVTSLYNVKNRGWKFFQLKKRFGGSFPTITSVLLTDKKQRKSFWISPKLLDGIKNRLQKKEQTILFLNRRGMSFFVQCEGCSHIFNCKGCSVSLTLHADDSLRCHYCQFQQQKPSECPGCHKKDFVAKGVGTQKLVTILQKLLPQARIARADMDTSSNKRLWKQTIEDFENQKLDILIGTQTITKGFHFPNVTLVGIIWADINLNFPIFNAQETTLQQLIQVAGRAGRQSPHSDVIVQSMTNHKIFNYSNEVDYLSFFAKELEQRKMLNYPPFVRFVEIELKHKKEELVDGEAHRLAYEFMKNRNLKVLGPTRPPVHKIKHTFSRKIYIKCASFADAQSTFSSIDKRFYKSALFFTPNPLS